MAFVEPLRHHANRNTPKVLPRCPRLEMRPPTVEAIEQAVEERVVVGHDNLLFNKQHMQKMSELVESDPKDGLARLFEQLWHMLTRQQSKKPVLVMRHDNRWKPGLQSIPEEI